MFSENQYQLIDFGGEKKLESFAGVNICRDTPSASGRWLDRSDWPKVDATCECSGKTRRWRGQVPEDWTLKFGDSPMQFELRLTPTGQVGVFPEQAINWDWILGHKIDFTGKKAINLFGYTGGTTMALATRGAEVAHVDAASSVVKWARSNADRSGLSDAPIRWIVEDARRFVQREIKRGNRYDVVVADPPSFGRGPAGEIWKLERDLEVFAEEVRQLLSETPSLVLISCHTPGIVASDLKSIFRHAVLSHSRSPMANSMQAFEMKLPVTNSAVTLPSGCCFRWSAG